MVTLKIDGKTVQAQEGTMVLEAAYNAGINIPTLCHLKDINNIGACRMCLVEDAKTHKLSASCMLPVSEGLEVLTRSPAVINARKFVLELILSDHDRSCLTCVRNGTCELQALAEELGVREIPYDAPNKRKASMDDLSPSIVRDNGKCILCRRCVAVCQKVQHVGVIGMKNRGYKTEVGVAFDHSLGETACINCGQCIAACPVGALTEKDATQAVWAALADPEKYVVFQPAPAVRVAIGEEFGMPIGTACEGKLAAAMRALGADKVFDVDFAADLTIMEEGTELLQRIQNGGVLPMITSCSPGWIKYCEHYHPDMIPNLSTCKSPQQMFGATLKTWYAQKMGWNKKDVFVVGIMPCTAKKFEVQRDDEDAAGVPDVDVSLTTRELARMIKRASINFNMLPDEEFDDPMGESTGAGVIFGATGGVMEAALRTAAEWVTGKPLENVEFTEVRGTQGIKEASYQLGDLTVNVAVASGLANAKVLLDQVKSGMKNYHFIEIMGCPGGCVNGGGQPVQPASVRNFVDLKSLRAKALYDADEAKPIRKSHENPSLNRIYEEYFGEYGSHLAHRILHTSYVERSQF